VRYLVRTLIGFGLIAFAWVTLGYSLNQLLQIGTCASGGPYVSARQCPDGTAGIGLMIPAAIVAMLIGAAIYAGRGRAPGSDRPPNNGLLAVWVWTGIFWSISAGCLLGVWGPEANPGPGGKEGGLIVGLLFVPMGALGLLAINFPWSQKRGAKASALSIPGAGRIAKAAVKRAPGLDPVGRLERLTKLRDQGVVTDAEFERLKQEILNP
jgi:putative oligomerization/nucleic acid binding protein